MGNKLTSYYRGIATVVAEEGIRVLPPGFTATMKTFNFYGENENPMDVKTADNLGVLYVGYTVVFYKGNWFVTAEIKGKNAVTYWAHNTSQFRDTNYISVQDNFSDPVQALRALQIKLGLG